MILKKNILSFNIIALLLLASVWVSCNKSTTPTTKTNTTSTVTTTTQNGQAVFWSPVSGTTVTVQIGTKDSLIGSTTQVYTATPTCSALGCVVFVATPGAYNYISYNATYGTKTGVVNITSGGCVVAEAN